jgi:hypothetical protein
MIKKLVASLALSAAVVRCGAFDELLTVDCSGNAVLIPNLPIATALDMSGFVRGYDALFQTIKDRATCQCNDLSNADFDLMYDPLVAGMNILSNSTSYPTTCAGKFPRNLTDFGDFINVNIPDSCSLDTYRKNGQCSLQFELPKYKLALGAALKKCPNSKWHQIVVGCSGEGCASFLQPCATSNDCSAGLTCRGFGTRDQQISTAFTVLQGMLLADGPSPSCFQKTNVGDAKAENDFLTNMLTFLKSNIWGGNQVINNIALCGADLFYDDWELSTDLEGDSNFRFDYGFIETNLSKCYTYDEVSTIDVKLGNLKNWNGMLSNGKNAFNDPTDPSFEFKPSPDHVTLAKVSCSGEVNFMDGKMKAKAGKLVPALTHVVDLMQTMQTCRGGKALDDNQFLTRFGLWSLHPYLYQIDASSYPDTVSLGPGFYDYLKLLGFKRPSNVQVELPPSCTYESFSKGKCALLYEGVNSLLKMNLTMKLFFKRCEKSPKFWEMEAQCVGKDCKTLFGELKNCKTSADCGGSLVCTDFSKIVDIPDDLDPLGLLLPTNASDWCGEGSDQKCSRPGKFKDEVHGIFSKAAQVASFSANDPLKFCSIDDSLLSGDQLQLWAQRQIKVRTENGVNFVSLPFLKEAAIENDSSDDGKDFNSGNSLLSYGTSLLGLFAVWTFFMMN